METVETRLLVFRQAVECALDEALSSRPNLRSQQAARAAVLSPGKRIRPMITLLVTEQLGTPFQRALPAAVAVEMIHAASLVLDDLPCMDNAETRRGEPAVHRSFGQDMALLAVITMVNGAYGTLAAAPGARDVQRRGWAEILAGAVGPMGLVGGQERDLSGCAGASLEDIRSLHRRKTAVLFKAAAQMGALAAEADTETVAAAGRFGEAVGLALQAFDDLADAADRAEINRGSNLLHRLNADATRAEARTRLSEAGLALGAADRRLGDVAPYLETLLSRMAAA
jgi:geranylgeranyl diphosphate synthase type II